MYQTNNPLQALINDAHGIQKVLYQDTVSLGLAMEQRQAALDAKRKAEEIYKAQESEVIFDLMFSDETYGKAKNAEQREIIKDRALVQARQTGALAQAWRALNSAQDVLSQAEMCYAQAEMRFKGVRCAAELQAAMLRGMVADSDLMK